MSRSDTSTFSDLERYGALDLAPFRPLTTSGPDGWRLARQLLDRERSLLGIADLAACGEGAHGWVFRARQPTLGREVAIKVGKGAPPRVRIDPLELQAQGMARLDHPSIPRIYAHGYLGLRGPSYLMLPWIEGPPLAVRLEDPAHPFAIEELARVARELASALRHAHARGVVHGDLRPANVILPTSGAPAVALLDWHGPARASEAERGTTPSPDEGRVSAAGSLAHRSSGPTPAIDLHALGALLAEALQRTVPPIPPALPRVAARARAAVLAERHAEPEGVASILAEIAELDPWR